MQCVCLWGSILMMQQERPYIVPSRARYVWTSQGSFSGIGGVSVETGFGEGVGTIGAEPAQLTRSIKHAKHPPRRTPYDMPVLPNHLNFVPL